ncbi:MAG: hypothetical protein ACFFCW_14310 [Candidatus Hodarchaeota archaeon]
MKELLTRYLQEHAKKVAAGKELRLTAKEIHTLEDFVRYSEKDCNCICDWYVEEK